jgi:ABC-type protease/lipase transport system fused ATPase/permease subunit
MGWTGNRGWRRAAPALLPLPEGRLEVERVTVRSLVGVGFRAEPGECVALAGPGSDRGTLCRVLAGRLRPEAGTVRLGGVPLDRYPPRQLAWLVGHLPAEVDLSPGTVTDNIARMSALPEPELVAEAAELAGAHEAILRLPEGYATRLGRGGAPLAEGLQRRIGLARALYGNPRLVVLEEPDAGLDAAGEAALAACLGRLKAARVTVVMAPRRPHLCRLADRVVGLGSDALPARAA